MHAHRTPAMVRGLGSLVLAFVVLTSFAGTAGAQSDSLFHDHYKVYQQTHPQLDPLGAQVTLRDQFLTTTHVVLSLDYFSNPVEKRHGPGFYPIRIPYLHYSWWKFEPEVPLGVDVIASNQFGDQTLHIDRAVYLLNPALKNEASDVPLPLANHYKCYACSGQGVGAAVTLVDQFFARDALVTFPRFFCTPTEKLFNGINDPILVPDLHYVVYEIDPMPLVWTAVGRDQFMSQIPLVLSPDRFLMVPTAKIPVTPAAPSTWGRLKSQYR